MNCAMKHSLKSAVRKGRLRERETKRSSKPYGAEDILVLLSKLLISPSLSGNGYQ